MSFTYLIDKISKENGWDKLNKEQQEFCISALSGNNILLTGAAGSGKSFALSYLFNFLEKNRISFGKTSLSGISALNIGGSTIHSWLGVGLANTDMSDIFKWVHRNKKAKARIESAKILFIDEISLCSGNLFNIINIVLKTIRKDKSPFGGISVIISGDVLQLPPIFKDLQNSDDFFFNCRAWDNGRFKPLELTTIIRQENDQEFSKILNEIRVGDTSNIHKIQERIDAKLDLKESIRPIRLLGYNKSVDNWNIKCLESIDAKEIVFWSKDSGEDRHREYFDRNCPSPSKLILKVGCQVMLTYNIDVDGGLANGLIGKVVGFEEKLPVVKFINGVKAIIDPQKWEIKEQIVNRHIIEYKSVASRTQLPLRLAFASSYHRAQGSTLDFLEVDLNQAFTDGMAYSALSRARTLEGIRVLGNFNIDKIKVNQKCLDFYNSIKKP